MIKIYMLIFMLIHPSQATSHVQATFLSQLWNCNATLNLKTGNLSYCHVSTDLISK